MGKGVIMWIILDLDDITDVKVVQDDEGIGTLLFTSRDKAREHAEIYYAIYQLVELDEE
jgi:hypothetical protein